MANPAAATRSEIAQRHPSATVKARYKSELVMSNGDTDIHVSHSGQIHYGPNNDQEIDSDWVEGGGLGGWRMANPAAPSMHGERGVLTL